MNPGVRIAASVVAFGVVACVGPREAVEPEAPAPDFNYISDEQLQSAMWQLAAGVKSLEAIFGNQEPVTRSDRLEVLRILDQMILAADELGPDGVSTNHPRVSIGLGPFREKLAIARNSVAMEPPRYYLVGNLSGTCFACHSGQ